MNISGAEQIPFTVDRVWDALLDPAVLVRTIPGCERLEATGEDAYAMTVTAGVASIKGTYAGTCALSDLVPRESLVMRLKGAGAPGTVDATVHVTFESADGGTAVRYDADAVVGGMVGGVGQRMLASVSRRMAGEFFGNVSALLSAAPEDASFAVAPAADAPAPTGGRVFTASPASAGPGSGGDFVKGIAVGAGLVLLGVVAGSVFGRRR